MQEEEEARLDRSPLKEQAAELGRGISDGGFGAGEALQLLARVQADLVTQGAIEDQADAAFLFTVLDDEDDGAVEVGIFQIQGGDQQGAYLERGGHRLV